MRRKISTGFLALVLLLQAFIPSLAYAKEAKNNDNEAVVKEEQISNSDLITIGKLKGVGFSKDNPTASISVEKVEQEKNHSTEASNELEFGDEIIPQAVRGSGSPYINGQQPADSDKPKYLANVVGKLTMIGLDGGDFDWDKVLGKDAKINLLFNQFSGNITTGVSFILSIDKDGKYSLFNAERKHDPDKPWEYYWVGSDNKPTELPLYDVDGNAYTYSVQTSRSYGENVQLIISETSGTPGSSFRPVGDKHIATIVFNMSIRQVASTKFVSEWNTSVKEADRPQIEGYFKVEDDVDNDFNFPLNNTSETILRDGFLKNFEEGDEETGPWPFLSSELETTPKTVKVKTDTPGLEFNTRWGKKIVTHGDHIYRYDFNYDVINGGKLTMTEIIPVVFNPNGGEFNDNRIEDKDKANDYTVWVEYGGSVYDDVPKEVIKKENTFLGWTLYPEYNPYAEPKSSFENIKTKKTFYALFEKDVKEQDQEQIPGRENYPYTMAHFDLTDKAKIRPEVSGEKVKRHFQVWSKNKVTLPVVEPVGITEKDADGRSFTWKFKYWQEVDGNRKWYIDENTPYVVDEFLKKDTYIKAVFEKDYTSNSEQVETYTTHESAKDDSGNIINNIQLPTFEDLQKQIKIKKGDNFVAIDTLTDPKEKVIVEYVKGKDASGNEYADFNTEIYDKLQEKENPKENGIEKPTRIETIKAQLTYPDGEVKTVDIPIKVIKNIYEAKTETQRPYYVPEEYVKVTLDPTSKATDPQKTYYYVNSKAQVVIPGKDPTGTGNNKFIKWAIGDTEYKLPERHQFTGETTIEAQYVSDVVPAKNDGNKPDGTPDNFVKVTFVPTDKATDTTPKIFYVNPEKAVTIPVDNPVGVQYYTFKEWTIGGTSYNPSEAKQFKEETTITATYTEAQNIIPYDPKEPTTRPDGYVRVTFEAEKGLTLSNDKAYYVKKGAGITLKTIKDDTTKYGYPAYKEETGYKFKEWNKKDDTVIGNDDVVVKALATILSDTKEKKEGEEKPAGYVEVKFVAGENGTVEEKTYFVNPNKYVTLTPPTATGNTGYEFGSWSKDATVPTQYTAKETTITARFNQIDAVSKEDKPGYVKVEFIIDSYKGGGRIASGETSVYYVDPNRKVTLTPPTTLATTGYEFDQWNPDPRQERQYQTPTQIKGSFKELRDIIPEKEDGKTNAKPDGYVTLEFTKGDNGTLDGTTIYYINPNKGTKLGAITKPTVKPEVGYKHTGWTTGDSFEFKVAGSHVTSMALYEALPDIIPKTTNDDSEKPDGYVEVRFVAGKNGKLIDNGKTIDEKVYYVNPEKYVKLTAPTDLAKGNTGYVFSTWDRDISNYNKFTDKVTTITANFVAKDAVVPKTKDDSEKPAGFVTVKFEVDPQSAGQGSLEGTTTYFVDPNQDVTLSPPKTNPSIGYEFEKWDQDTTQAKKYKEDTTVTVTFKKLDDIIPGDQAQPKGYLTVTFVADSNGSLSGTSKYYVKPNTSVDLSKQANAITKTANLGYTEKDGTWTNQKGKKLKDTFSENAEFVFNFVELADVIPAEGNVDQPKGYVKVEFIAGENGSLKGGDKTYYVNPLKEIKVGSKDLPIPQTTPKDNYKFDKWLENIDKNEVITTDKKYVATFKINKVTMTYQAEDKTSGEVPEALSYEIGTEITLAGGNNLKKDNYLLTGWKIGDKTYKPGEKFTINENTRAIAVWETDYHTVNFDTQGGEYIPSQKVKHNESIGPVTNPVKENHTFTGWKVNGKDFDPETAKVEKDITLVAQYVSDVVPAKNDGSKPEGTPDNFVKVIFVPTDKATDTTQKIFYVNPDKEVTIPVSDPVGKVGKDQGKTVQWQFTGWDIPLKGTFTAPETTITAQYKAETQVPGSVSYLVTEEGVQPTPDQYKGKITPPDGKNIAKVEIVGRPDVSKPGVSTADLKVTYTDGTSSDVTMTVFVQRKPQTDWQTGTLGPTRTRTVTVVEKEIVKVPAEKAFRKEVRYMQGYNNYFRPGAGLTRAEAAQILANALVEDGYRYDPNFAIHYKDIVGNEWYAKAIRITSQANVFKGYDTGYFDPHKKITRAEWIGTLRRFQELERVSGNHMQVRADHWAMGEIEAAYKEGWLAIYGQGLAKFNADEFIPRQEVAAVSNKAFNRVLDKTYIHRNNKNLINYKDVNPSLWSYEDILCASNGFIHDGKSFWGHKVDYKKDLYNLNLDGYTVTKDKFQRLERR